MGRKSCSGLLVDLGQLDKLKELVESAPLGDERTYWNLLAGNDSQVIAMADQELADNPYLEYTRVNKAIALKRLGRDEEKEEELCYLESQIKDGLLQYNTRPLSLLAGIEALKGNREKLLDHLEQALKSSEVSPRDVRRFPVFEDFRDDVAFKSLVVSHDPPKAIQLTMETMPQPLQIDDAS